jgi:UDP-2-acetamido-3-amino-2,3-dideoxy-glucuronate N-acetyltransferase
MNNLHPLSDVQSKKIGSNTRIWQFCVVLPNAQIGDECNICAQVLIENDVVIGDRVTVKSGVQLWDGIRLEDDVFVGPNVTFTNDKFPRSKNYLAKHFVTTIEAGASIGGGATILPGLSIGRNAMIGSGSVVTRSIPPNAIVVGNPARIIGYVNAPAKDVDQVVTLKNDAVKRNSRVRGVSLNQFTRIVDIRGSLVVGEFERNLPFAAKRYFLVFDVPSRETRGEHAHRECHQFLICVHGRCSVVVDDGDEREEFQLDSPNLGLHLPPMTWGIQYKYSPDAVLLVFASHYYDAGDYIRNYDEFLSLVNNDADINN